MAYLPNSDDDRRAMLATLGVDSVDALFTSVPESLRNPQIELSPALGEQELVAELERLAARNRPLSSYDNFLGAGVYRRFSPAIVRATVSRPEFFTAYTPYQAEASQGTLQTIFEFQSMIAALTGLDVANASLYDGATAAAEAMVLAVGANGRDRVLVAGDVHPETLRVLRTFAQGRRIGLDVVDAPGGALSPDAIAAAVRDVHAAVLVQQPTFFGTVADLAPVVRAAHDAGALALCSTDLFASALITPPGEMGFDVAIGDGQPLGIPASFGGPHVGFMAVRTSLMRRIPGRLAGITVDADGRRAFTLTLQAREQHIRREHATSNICTNHALIALAATTYMAHMGAGGMRALAELSTRRAHHLAEQLTAIEGFGLAQPDQPFLWEFALRCPGDAEEVEAELRREGILAGLPLGRIDSSLGDQLLVCCTETSTPDAIAHYVSAARRLARTPAGARA
ncbi:MAG TPA: aminomethyl-transferring glycine dehydrogenase subunit GcvPA [Candidatus Dormibacteraeota bacterium]|nr:aminomethyl-transferring glycine dehydrogenase subunit GcvPA [Candidatus Dormibacteraeota bacterium]